MKYIITFPDVWTALRFAQLYQDHLYISESIADVMLYQDDPHGYQKCFKIKKPITDLTELSDIELFPTLQMIRLYSDTYKLNKVALVMQFSVHDFYASFAPNWAIDLTDVRHKYRTYAEYKGEAFDVKHNTKYFGYVEQYLNQNGYEPPVYLDRSLLVPMN